MPEKETALAEDVEEITYFCFFLMTKKEAPTWW